jgi:hypothetical protein
LRRISGSALPSPEINERDNRFDHDRTDVASIIEKLL